MICRSIFLTVLISLDLLHTGFEISQVAIFFVPCVKKNQQNFMHLQASLDHDVVFQPKFDDLWHFLLNYYFVIKKFCLCLLVFLLFSCKIAFFIFLLVQIISYTHAIFFTIFTRKKTIKGILHATFFLILSKTQQTPSTLY